MVYTLRVFLFKYSWFHNSKIFGSCIIHVLYTECAKIEKNNSGAQRINKEANITVGSEDVEKEWKSLCEESDGQQSKTLDT
jgi:hypothetical protein